MLELEVEVGPAPDLEPEPVDAPCTGRVPPAVRGADRADEDNPDWPVFESLARAREAR